MPQHLTLQRLFEYQRGQSSDDDKTIIDQHLAGCPYCAENMKLFSAYLHARETATMHQRQPDDAAQDGCPPAEKIGRFINNDLPKRQQQEIEKHLAVCGACRRQLVSIFQAGFAPVNDEEKILLEAWPSFAISEQVRAIKKLMPDKPRLSDFIRQLAGRLGWFVPTLDVPRPAWTFAVVLALGLIGKWWAWPAYQYYRLASQGESQLLEQSPIFYSHTLRPAYGYRSSDEAERMGPEEGEQTIATLLKQALVYNQDGEKARLRLAQYFLLQKNYSSGDSLLKLLEATSPQNAAVLNDRGIWLYDQEKLNAAAAAFQRAFTLNPHLDEALYNLAITQTQLGDTTAAKTSWKKYLALDNVKTEWRNAAKAQLLELE